MVIDELTLISGVDIPIPELQVNIKQPKIKDIAYIGENNFFTYLSYFNINNNILENLINKENFILEEIYESYIEEIRKLTNLETLFLLIESNILQKDEIEYGIITILNLLMPEYLFQFDYEDKVIIGYGQNVIIIRPQNFNIIRDIINIIFNLDALKNDVNEDYNPADEKAREILEKIKKGKKKAQEQFNNNSNENRSLISTYISILCVGLGYAMDDILNLTFYQLINISKKYINKMQYDTQLQLSVLSMQSINNLQHWIF